jgi:hypothetical protein
VGRLAVVNVHARGRCIRNGTKTNKLNNNCLIQTTTSSHAPSFMDEKAAECSSMQKFRTATTGLPTQT